MGSIFRKTLYPNAKFSKPGHYLGETPMEIGASFFLHHAQSHVLQGALEQVNQLHRKDQRKESLLAAMHEL